MGLKKTVLFRRRLESILRLGLFGVKPLLNGFGPALQRLKELVKVMDLSGL